MKTFKELGLNSEFVSLLDKAKITTPTEIQEKTIPLVLDKKDVIGGSATGSGKTLAFASSIIENLKKSKNVQALILTPTRELAEQVSNVIAKFSRHKDLNVLSIYGGVSIENQIRLLKNTDVVVGTPGRILDHLNRKTLYLGEIKFVVLDEVDRMFDMGFQRDVKKILEQCPEKRQTMLFSATVSSEIDYLAKKYTKNPVEISVESHVDTSKLKQIYYDVETNKKFSLLIHLLKEEKSNLVMVFCSTRRNTDFVAENLCKFGIKAEAIHGGLIQTKRTRIIKEFQKDKIRVLVCTDVAARGLDIKGISHVYNYDIPRETKDYIHRIGRTARAGKEGTAINILSSRDYENFSNIVNREEVVVTPTELPRFQKVMIRMDSQKPKRFDREYSRRPPSRGSRRDSRGRSDNKDYSRRPNKEDSRRRSDNRDSGRKSYGRDSRRPDNKNSRERSNNRSFRRDSGEKSYDRDSKRSYNKDSRKSYRGNSRERDDNKDSRRDNKRKPFNRNTRNGKKSGSRKNFQRR